MMNLNFYFQTNDIVELLAALLAPLVAIFAVYIAFQQHRINQRRYLHEKHQIIVKLRLIVGRCYAEISKESKISYQNLEDLIINSFDVDHYLNKKTRISYYEFQEKASSLYELKDEIDSNQPGFEGGKSKMRQKYGLLIMETKRYFWIMSDYFTAEFQNLNKRAKK